MIDGTPTRGSSSRGEDDLKEQKSRKGTDPYKKEGGRDGFLSTAPHFLRDLKHRSCAVSEVETLPTHTRLVDVTDERGQRRLWGVGWGNDFLESIRGRRWERPAHKVSSRWPPRGRRGGQEWEV